MENEEIEVISSAENDESITENDTSTSEIDNNVEEGHVSQEQVDRITREVIQTMLANQEVTEEPTEEVTEEPTEEVTEEPTEAPVLNFLGDADHNLYLSSEVENADMNDIYSVVLSCRNIILLFVLIVLCYKGFSMLKSWIYKVMNL